MIKHVVCFKLKDNSYDKKCEARDVLLSMKGKVDLTATAISPPARETIDRPNRQSTPMRWRRDIS